MKEAASRYFCWGEARDSVYQTSSRTASFVCDKREFRIVLFPFRVRGALKILWGASKIY
jgi:hypothetical protein